MRTALAPVILQRTGRAAYPVPPPAQPLTPVSDREALLKQVVVTDGTDSHANPPPPRLTSHPDPSGPHAEPSADYTLSTRLTVRSHADGARRRGLGRVHNLELDIALELGIVRLSLCEIMQQLHARGRDIICVTPASRAFGHGSVT